MPYCGIKDVTTSLLAIKGPESVHSPLTRLHTAEHMKQHDTQMIKTKSTATMSCVLGQVGRLAAVTQTIPKH